MSVTTETSAAAAVIRPWGSRGRLRLERHVGECEECRLMLDGLREMLNALHRPSAPSGTGEPNRIAAAVRLRLREPPARD